MFLMSIIGRRQVNANNPTGEMNARFGRIL